MDNYYNLVDKLIKAVRKDNLEEITRILHDHPEIFNFRNYIWFVDLIRDSSLPAFKLLLSIPNEILQKIDNISDGHTLLHYVLNRERRKSYLESFAFALKRMQEVHGSKIESYLLRRQVITGDVFDLGVERESIEILRMLIDAGLDYSKRKNKLSTLYFAAKSNLEVLTFVYGLNPSSHAVNLTQRQFTTPLSTAITYSKIENCRFLVRHGANIRLAQDSYGNTLVHDATNTFSSTPLTKNKDENIAKVVIFLIRLGCPFNLKNGFDRTPFINAIRYGYVKTANILAACGDQLGERRMINLSEEEIFAIRQQVYFESSLTSWLLDFLPD